MLALFPLSLIRRVTLVLCLGLGLGLGLGLAQGAAAQGLWLDMPPDPARATISATTDAGLRSTRQLPTAALRAARRAMLAGQWVDEATLRALADRRDGTAAWNLVKRLRAQQAPAAEIAHYAAITAGTGRVRGLAPMIAAMHRLTPDSVPPEDLRLLVNVLYAHAWAGNSLAMDGVIAFNGEGRLLGPMGAATRTRLLQQGVRMDGRVELRLALDLLARDTPGAADLATARSYLTQAAGSKTLAVAATAQNVIALLDAWAVQTNAPRN